MDAQGLEFRKHASARICPWRAAAVALAVVAVLPSSLWAARVVLSPGVRIAVRLDETISTKSHYFGPIIQGTLDQDIVDSRGRVVIPAGSTVKLAMAEFKRAGRVFGRARLRLRLFSVVLPDGSEIPLDGYATSLDNKRKPGAEGTFHGRHGLVKDAAFDLTAVTSGAGAGFVVGGPWGLPAGAAAGLLTAGIWTVARRGPDLVLPAGTVIEFTLGRPAGVDEPGRAPDPPQTTAQAAYAETALATNGPTWGQGLVIPPSPDLVALLDRVNDPHAVLNSLGKLSFRNRPDSDRVFADYLRGLCEMRLSNSRKAVGDLDRAYTGAKRLNMPQEAQSEIARNLVIALKNSSADWESSPLMNDPQLQAVLVQPEGSE